MVLDRDAKAALEGEFEIARVEYIEKREEISWSRNAIFWAFGFGYLGCLQWFIYVDVFKFLWPNMQAFASMTLREKLANPAGIRALFGQVAFDNFKGFPDPVSANRVRSHWRARRRTCCGLLAQGNRNRHRRVEDRARPKVYNRDGLTTRGR